MDTGLHSSPEEIFTRGYPNFSFIRIKSNFFCFHLVFLNNRYPFVKK